MSYFGIDWGSSSFRAYRFNERAEVVDTIVDDKGILRLENVDFEQTLFKLLGPLLNQGDRLMFSGMITSRNGWIETPYTELPASIEGYLADGLKKRIRGFEMIFLPGVCQRQPADVIRGEELQIFGVCAEEKDATVILPGTHSKWVQVRSDVITGFKTAMTGELYDLLMKRSLIGMIAEGDDYDEGSFLKGIEAGVRSHRDQSILAAMFTARAAVLLNQLEASQVASYLSGLLIGCEVESGLRAAVDRTAAPLIIGDELLCRRYGTALSVLGCSRYRIKADASIQGFARLIEQLSG
ncbi:MAG: 2-dehydro-3-deoxygalactonokinase [Desulfofustis sp.]|jgi:2-dehydro-3-deoxygalactonokinase